MSQIFEFRDERLDWLAQWCIAEMYYSDQYHSVQSLNRQFQEHDAVSESKIRRRLDRLEEAEMLDVDGQRVAPNVNKKKLYRLDDDGVFYYKEMKDKLAKPPHIRNLELLEYLQDETDALEHYVRQLVQVAQKEGHTIESWSE